MRAGEKNRTRWPPTESGPACRSAGDRSAGDRPIRSSTSNAASTAACWDAPGSAAGVTAGEDDGITAEGILDT